MIHPSTGAYESRMEGAEGRHSSGAEGIYIDIHQNCFDYCQSSSVSRQLTRQAGRPKFEVYLAESFLFLTCNGIKLLER